MASVPCVVSIIFVGLHAAPRIQYTHITHFWFVLHSRLYFALCSLFVGQAVVQTLLKNSACPQSLRSSTLAPALSLTLWQACECLLMTIRVVSSPSKSTNYRIAVEGIRTLAQVMVTVGCQEYEINGKASHEVEEPECICPQQKWP